MSYPPYQRSAKKNQSRQSDQHNDNPFKPTASTSSNVPSIFRIDNNTKVFQSGLEDRPSKVTYIIKGHFPPYKMFVNIYFFLSCFKFYERYLMVYIIFLHSEI